MNQIVRIVALVVVRNETSVVLHRRDEKKLVNKTCKTSILSIVYADTSIAWAPPSRLLAGGMKF